MNEVFLIISKEIPWYWSLITFISGLLGGVVVMGLCAFGNYRRGFSDGFREGESK